MPRAGKAPAGHEQRRTCGLQLSVVDGLVPAAACAISVLLFAATDGDSLSESYVARHFFLSCNVLHTPERLELIRNALFVSNCALQLIIGHPDVSVVFCIQSGVTVLLLVKQIRQHDDHGIFARRLNARRDERLNR